MTMIKKAAAILLAAVIALSLAGCGKELSPLEKLAGYYEVDLEKAIPVLYADLNKEEQDIELTDMRSSGYVYSITIDKEGKGKLSLVIEGVEQFSQDIIFDPDKETADYGGNTLPYTYKNRTIELDGLSFVKTTTKSAARWPFGAFVEIEGADGIGYFWVPDDWTDETVWSADDLSIEFSSPDQDYYLTVYSYPVEEWKNYDPEIFESSLSLLDALLSNTREKYASSIDTDDTFETEVDGCAAVRNDMTFTDSTGYSSVIYRDKTDTYHVILFETFSEEATSHMDDFAQYVLGHFRSR